MKYRPEIDGLRALSIIPVILYHAEIDFFKGGFIGVDIFFVISGYLITSILISEIEINKFNFFNFIERRLRRILPALLLVIIFSIPFSIFVMFPDQLELFSQSLISTVTFVSNIFYWREIGYFMTEAFEKPLLHTWSLSVEMQFYLIFPLVLLCSWKLFKKEILWILIIIFILSFGLAEYGSRYHPGANFYFLPTRIWELISGSIAAFLLFKYKIRSNTYLSLIGIFLILISFYLFNQGSPWPSFLTIIPILGTTLVIVYSYGGTLTSKILGLKLLVYFGLISYSAYLWHYLIFSLARIYFFEVSNTIYFLMISLTFILATLTFYCVERPFRNRILISKKKFLQLTIISISSIIIFGVIVNYTNTYKDIIFEKTFLTLFESKKRKTSELCDSVELLKQCINKGNKNKSVLLLGDSNAYHFSHVLNEITNKFKLNFINATKGGCLPLYNFYRLEQSSLWNKHCFEYNNEVERFLKNSPYKIDTIIVSGAWLLHLQGPEFYEQEAKALSIYPVSKVVISRDRINKLNKNDRVLLFDKYINRLLNYLSKKTDKIILVGPIPPALINFKKKKSFTKPKSSLYERFKYYEDDFQNIIEKAQQKHNFIYIAPSLSLCDHKQCKVLKNNLYLYSDPRHLSEYGQKTVFEDKFNELLKLD